MNPAPRMMFRTVLVTLAALAAAAHSQTTRPATESLSPASRAESRRAANNDFHVVRTKARDVRCTVKLVLSSQVPFQALEVILPIPPSCDAQEHVGERVIKPPTDDSYEATEYGGRCSRSIQRFDRGDRPTRCTVVFSDDLAIFSRSIKPGRPAAPPTFPEPSWSSATLLYDFENPVVRRWIDSKHLVPDSNEDDLSFARRALKGIYSSMTFASRGSHSELSKLSELITRSSGDCGDFSVVFAGVMRASGIPARALAGKWARSSVPAANDDVALQRMHVNAEFFAAGVGWVPVNPTANVRDPNWWEHVGQDYGEFVVFQLDPGIEVARKIATPIRSMWFQGPTWWAFGPSDWKSVDVKTEWTVADR